MYKVLVMFTDLQDGGYKYEVGDTYPRKGLEPSEARIEQLATANNKRGQALIEKVAEKKKAEPKEEPVEEKPVEEKPKAKKTTKKR